MGKDGSTVKTSQIIALMSRMNEADLNYTKSNVLHTFDGKPGFTVAQGE
jgi:hypothetical protein